MASINFTKQDKDMFPSIAECADVPYENVLPYLENNPDLFYDFKADTKNIPRFYNKDVKKAQEMCAKRVAQQKARAKSNPLVRKLAVRDRLREKLAQKNLTTNIKESDVK